MAGAPRANQTRLPETTLALQVRDLERAATFYEHEFGLERTPSSPPDVVVFQASTIPFAALAPLFGLSAPVRPQRGQILVTERTTKAWPIPLGSIRQTPEGSILLGSSEEEVGFDTSQKPEIMQKIAGMLPPEYRGVYTRE